MKVTIRLITTKHSDSIIQDIELKTIASESESELNLKLPKYLYSNGATYCYQKQESEGIDRIIFYESITPTSFMIFVANNNLKFTPEYLENCKRKNNERFSG